MAQDNRVVPISDSFLWVGEKRAIQAAARVLLQWHFDGKRASLQSPQRRLNTLVLDKRCAVSEVPYELSSILKLRSGWQRSQKLAEAADAMRRRFGRLESAFKESTDPDAAWGWSLLLESMPHRIEGRRFRDT